MQDERVSVRSSTASYLADKLEYEERYRILERNTTELKRESALFHATHAAMQERVDAATAQLEANITLMHTQRDAAMRAESEAATLIAKLRSEKQRLISESESMMKVNEQLRDSVRDAQRHAVGMEEERDTQMKLVAKRDEELRKLTYTHTPSSSSLSHTLCSE